MKIFLDTANLDEIQQATDFDLFVASIFSGGDDGSSTLL
jgi:hypothetical protein